MEKNEKRVKYSCELSAAGFIMQRLKKEHPDIYQRYLTLCHPDLRSPYDDNNITIEDLGLDNSFNWNYLK